MNEQQAREYIRKLRRFYTDAFIYVVVNLGLVLIWAISGGGYFWPIWVIIGWGIGLGVHAFSLGLIPQMDMFAPFLTPEWEEQEVRRLMGASHKTKEEKKETMKADIKSEGKIDKKTAVAKAKPNTIKRGALKMTATSKPTATRQKKASSKTKAS